MAKIALTPAEIEDLENQDDAELNELVAINEMKRRRIEADKKAYSGACNDAIKRLEASTEKALEVIHQRYMSAYGKTLLPATKPVVEMKIGEQPDNVVPMAGRG